MRETVDKVWTQIKDFFTGLSKGEKIRFFILAAAILVLAVILAYVLGRTEYAVLYSGLSPQQSGDLIQALDELGVKYKQQGTSTLLVPEEQLDETLSRLAAGGFSPAGSGLGMDIIQAGMTSSATNAEREAFERRQRGQHIETLIQQMDRITNALVILDTQEQSTYAGRRNTAESTATVMLSVKDGRRLTQSEADAIGAIVLGAVSGLKAENISIVDSSWNTYQLTGDSDGFEAPSTDIQLELQNKVRSDIEQQVLDFLTPVFGYGKVRAMVHVVLNFDERISESIEYAPPVPGSEEGIIISLERMLEQSRYYDEAQGVPGTDTNGMGSTEYPWGEMDANDYYRKALETINYEINQTTTQIKEAKGKISNLSIAVYIDDSAADLSTQVRNLLTTALGVPENLISVERMPIVVSDPTADWFQEQEELQKRENIMEIIKLVINGILILLLAVLIFLLARMIIGAITNQPKVAVADGTGLNIDFLAGEDDLDADLDLLDESLAEIDLNQKSEGILQLENFIERDPQAVAQLLRNWIVDD